MDDVVKRTSRMLPLAGVANVFLAAGLCAAGASRLLVAALILAIAVSTPLFLDLSLRRAFSGLPRVEWAERYLRSLGVEAEVRVTNSRETPAATAPTRRPIILISSDALSKLTREEVMAILAHEAYHVMRIGLTRLNFALTTAIAGVAAMAAVCDVSPDIRVVALAAACGYNLAALAAAAREEVEADRFSARVVGGSILASALKRLGAKSSPIHGDVSVRLARLSAIEPARRGEDGT